MAQYDYWLNRDSTESDRLNRQHALLTRALGYHLHPSIKATLSSTARIADVATGTGIVLTDLAKEVPSSCTLDGYDISDAQFPDSAALPSNVHLYVANAKEPFQAELHGKYDVVLVRYLTLALSIPDWPVVTANILSLLKPGGYIHWIEPDLIQAIRFVRSDAHVPCPAYRFFADRFHPAAVAQGMDYPCKELEGVIKAHGTHDVVHEMTSTDRFAEDRPMWTINTLAASTVGWKKLEESKGEYSAHAVDDSLAQLYEEGRTALYSRYDLHTFIAKKS